MSNMISNVFMIPFHVTPTKNSIMPEGLAGAYVRCYSGSKSFEEAMKVSVEKLQSDGLYPEEALEPFEQMDSSQWHLHIGDDWPDHVDGLLSQDEFNTAMSEGRVVYGPFGAYNPQ